MHALLEDSGIQHEFLVSDRGHSMTKWRHYLRHFIEGSFNQP
jgi:hypothetical protein